MVTWVHDFGTWYLFYAIPTVYKGGVACVPGTGIIPGMILVGP